MVLCPMPRISCSSATESSSRDRSNNMRRRFVSPSTRRDFTIDGMAISDYCINIF